MSRVPVAPLVKFAVFTVIVALATTVVGMTISNASSGVAPTYSARFTDVTGLLPGDDVRIAGVRVGSVERVSIADRRHAEVRFTVRPDQRLPASVTATVLYKNLIGQRYLSLGQGTGSTGITLRPGDSIPIERTRPPLNLTVLFNGFKPLFTGLDPEQINKLSGEIVAVLQGEGATVEQLLASTASLTSEIANRDQVIGEVITNLNAVLETVASRDEELSGLIVTLRELVSGLAADREPIGEAVDSIGELTQVTAGLIAEARPALREDIAALGELASNLNDSGAVVESVLRNAPHKLETLIRAGSYGSWFNFYLCEASGTVAVPPLIPPTEVTVFPRPEIGLGPHERCLGPNPTPAGQANGGHAENASEGPR